MEKCTNCGEEIYEIGYDYVNGNKRYSLCHCEIRQTLASLVYDESPYISLGSFDS